MKPSQGVGVPVEKGIYFSGAGEQRPNFEGKGRKKTILGNREHKKIKTWGTGEQTKLLQGNKRTREQVPHPYQGSVGPNRQILGVIRAKSDGSGESAHLSLA